MTIILCIGLFFLAIFIITAFVYPFVGELTRFVGAISFFIFLFLVLIYIYLRWESIVLTIVALPAIYICQYIFQRIVASIMHQVIKRL